MPKIIDLNRVRHARASKYSRAIRRARISAESSAACATSDDSTGRHQTAGIRSLCDHLRMAVTGAPTSAAIASMDGQSATTSRNDLISGMPLMMGPFVPKIKGKVSRDIAGQTVLNGVMGKSEHLEIFMAAVAEERDAAGLSQEQMAEALQIHRDTYKQYEMRSYLPHYLVLPFCRTCRIDPNRLYRFSAAKVHVVRRRRKRRPAA